MNIKSERDYKKIELVSSTQCRIVILDHKKDKKILRIFLISIHYSKGHIFDFKVADVQEIFKDGILDVEV